MQMIKVELKDIDEIKEIFLSYPFKNFQQQFQNIDKNTLSTFLAKNLTNTLNDINYENYFIPQKALLTINKDKWHSSIYNINMAKISNLVLMENNESIYPLIYEQIDNFVRKNSIQHLSCRLDISDFDNIQFLQQNGFYYVGESIKMCLKVEGDRRVSSVPLNPKWNFEIVDYKPEHKNNIKQIARTAHNKNYFFFDPNLDKQKTAILFEKWTERCIDSLAEKVFVAMKNKTVVGFLIYLINKKLNDALNKKIAILDFMAIDESCKGMKIGSGLLAHFINDIKDKYEMIELRTMNNNFPAINLYQKFGFLIISSDLIFHKYIKSIN